MRKLAIIAMAATCVSISCATTDHSSTLDPIPSAAPQTPGASGNGDGNGNANGGGGGSPSGGASRDGGAGADSGADGAGGSGGGNGGSTPPPGGSPPQGTIDVTLTADTGPANDAVVSLGVPFSQGTLKDEKTLALKDAGGKAVPMYASVLARWPADGSIRSVLVAFKATVAPNASQIWKLDYGGSPTSMGPKLDPNPDGPVAATLSADWYAASHVSGYVLPAAKNKRFAKYDQQLEAGFGKITWASWGVSCGSTTNHRTYYDGPHSRYQRFVRNGTPKTYRDARSEARWYRDNEVVWVQDRTMAIQACQASGWNPQIPLDQKTLRMMAAQGNLDDYLLTGDPAAKEVVLAFGEAYLQNIPALSAGTYPEIQATERNLGWPLMGLDSYFALDQSAKVKNALVGLVDRVVSWQNKGTSGALEHDVARADSSECENGPNGASPFMTSLVVDGLMDYWLLTQDTTKVEPVVRKMAEWYQTKAITSDKLAFRYLWNCLTDPYDDSGVADLNVLINHVFGATYLLTKDTKWLTFGDSMADSGIDAMVANRPKQWDQAARSFGKYLGYRALGAAP
jgi:hypothetical protein